jgi:argininosuccinate lyase
VAGRLHTGRSRNDQVATDLALYLRDAGAAAQRGLLGLRRVLAARAREHVGTVLPGYTHLQRAQPVRLAHHWLAFVEMLGRDGARFRDLGGRLRRCPLGAGALAGTTLPLDPEETARALGFEGPARNSMDAVASRDAALEFLAATAIAMVHLSRLAEELVLWSTAEFGFIELADAYATGSSLMPQKKNPDVPELVRGKSGRAIGNLVALLTVLKGLPLTYNRDLQEDKEPVFDSAATLRDSLEVMAGAVATLRVDVARMREAASDPMLLATDLAEALVRARVPFREAQKPWATPHCSRRSRSACALARTHAFHQPSRRRRRAGGSRARRGRAFRRRRAARVEAALDRAEARRARARGADARLRREDWPAAARARPVLALACWLRAAGGPPPPTAKPFGDGHQCLAARLLEFTRCTGPATTSSCSTASGTVSPRSSRWRRACATAASGSARTSSWCCAPRGRPISACRSTTPTARRWRCARTGSAPASSTCASTATPAPTRSASRPWAAS